MFFFFEWFLYAVAEENHIKRIRNTNNMRVNAIEKPVFIVYETYVINGLKAKVSVHCTARGGFLFFPFSFRLHRKLLVATACVRAQCAPETNLVARKAQRPELER